MVSKSNVSLLNKRLIEREKPHFALRKTTLGLASVLLSTTFYIGTQVVHADTVPVGSDAVNSNGQAEEMTNQIAGFETESNVNPQAQTQNQTVVNNNAANAQTQVAVQSAGNQNAQGQPQQTATQTTTQAVDEPVQKSVQSQNQKQMPQNVANQALTSAIDSSAKTDGANQAVSQVLSQSSNAKRNYSLNKLPSSITPAMLMTNLAVKPSDSYTSSAALEKIDFYAWSENFKEMRPDHPITINIDQANTRIGFDGKFRLTRDQLTKQNTIRLFDIVQTSDSSAYNVISLENNDSAFVLDGKQIGHYHLVIDERINDGIYQPNPKFKKLTLELVITDPLTNVVGSREIDANAPWIGTMSWSTPWAFRGMGSNSNITLSIQGQNTSGSQYKEDYHITYHKDPVSTTPIGINDNKDSYAHLLPQSGVAADGRMGLVLDAMHPGWSDKNWVNQFLSNHGTGPSINLNQYVERAARYSADGQSVIINANDQPRNVVHYGSMPAFNGYGQMYPESQSLSQPIGTASNVTIFPQNTSMLAMKQSGKTGYMVSQQDNGTVILYVKIPLTDLRVQESQRNNVVGSVIYTSSRINKVVTNDEQARQMANQWFSDWINGAQKGVPLNFSEIGPVARITSPFEHTTLHAQQLDVNTGLPIAGEDFTNTNVINDAKANGQVEVRVHYINNSTGAEIAQSKDFVDWPSAGKQVNVSVPTIDGYTLVTNLDGLKALKLTDGTTKKLNGTIVSNGNGLAYPESVSTTNNGVADYYFVYQKKVAQQANIQIQYVDDSGNVVSTDSNKILLNSQNQQATLSNLAYPHKSDTTYGWQIGPLDFVDAKGKSHVLTGLKLNVATGSPEFLMADGEVFNDLTTADHKAHILVDQGNHNYVLKISVAFFAKVILQEIDETTGKVVYSGESRTVAGTSGHYDSSNQMFAHYVWAPDQPAIDFTVNNKDSTQYIKIKVTPKIDDISKDTTDPNGNKLDTSRTVTRTINIKDLRGNTTTQKQSVTFTRSASYNEVTKQVSYGAWSENGQHVFADQTNQVPTIDGYTINPNGGSIGAVTVTPDSKSIVTNVTYDAKEQTVTIRYVYNGQAVGTYQVKGKTNEHTSLADVVSSNKPAGYSIDSTHVANNFSYTFTADPNQHYDVPVIQNIIGLKPGDSRVLASDFSRTITRTITMNIPKATPKVVTQSVTFNRDVKWNQVTNKPIYGAWSENGQHEFVAVSVQDVPGYTPNAPLIKALSVTPDSQSSKVVIDYTPNVQSFDVIYFDVDANVRVKVHKIASFTDASVPVGVDVPAGYVLVEGQSIPKTITFKASGNSDITVKVKEKVDTIDPNDPKTWLSNVTEHDLKRTITRTIVTKKPDGAISNQVQSITFMRGGKYNEATKQLVLGSWSEDGKHIFPAVPIIDIPGYQPDKSVDALTVTPDSSSSTVVVSYIAQPQGINIKYVDINADHKVVQVVPVKGVTGQTMPINIVVPAGYVLVDGQSIPKQITFMGTGNSDVTVQLKEKINTVNPNDPSTWPTSVTEHDLKRTITRMVTITKPDHTSSTQTQSVTFTRGATYNEVTKQVAYQPWSENGSHIFPVVPIPDIPGYKPDKAVDALTVNPDSTDSTVTVNYIAQPQRINVNYVDIDVDNKLVEAVPIKGVTDQTVSVNIAVPDGYVLVDGQSIPKSIMFKASDNTDITVQLKEKIDTVDINDPKTWPAGLTEHDLKRIITRDVTINNPDSTHSSQHQSVTFTRGATYNEVTKQVAYDPWSDGGKHTFDAVPIPPIRGYAPSQEVPALMVTPDSSDITETVTYRALGQSLVVHYLDLTNKPVGDQVLKGVTDQMIDVDLHLPAGWVLAPGQNVPKQIKFNGIHNVDMNVYVVHQITPVDPNNPSTIPNDHPLDQDAWKRDISRTVNITEPNGHKSSQTQSTEFTRSVSFDQVLKQYIFGPWSRDGMDTFAEITIPSHPGYVPSATAPKEIVTPDSKSEVVEVTYIANGQTTSYSFVDDDNNGSKVGEDHFIAGRTDETVPLSILIPGGYQLAANQTLPKTYHFASSDNQPLVIHLQHVLADATNDPKADTTRTITRTIEITNPDNKVTTDSQSVKFTRTAKKDAVTGNYIYGDWSNNGHQRFEAYIQPSLKGYNKTGSAPQVDVTPDTKDIKVALGYTKQPLRRLDPKDPSTWTKGLTHDDFERDISRTITLHAPNMQNPRVTKQSVTFTRDIYQDPVTDQLIYKDWQVAAGSPKFDAVLVPQVKGYQVSIEDIPAVTVTPDMKSSAVDVTYTQLADKQIDPNDPRTWPSNISEHDLKRTITRTIEFDNPDGTKSIKVQSMIFARRAHQNQVTDQIIFDPWSEDGSHQFDAVNVPSIKGYQSSLVRISALDVTPDSENSTVKVSYTKLPDLVVDPNDPVTWIDGLTEHDLKRTIKRTVVFNVPNGQPETKVQTVTFVRGAKIDQATDKITFDPWSENGRHQFDAVTVPNLKGYDANPGSIASWRVTPDSQDLTVNVAYNKQANRVIDSNDPKTWPDGILEHDLKRTVTRTITIHTPNAKPQVISQSVTFVRGASQDPVTDKITFDPWSENGQHQFGIVNVPKVKGYDASRSIVLGVVVTPDSKSFETVDVTYTKQANRRIDPNDPSTWPKGLNPDDLKRTISREIVFALPNGSSQKVLQTITFTRDGSQDPVSDKITWGPWSDNGKHHFDEVPVIEVKGYTSNINQIDALDVTPDTKLLNGGRVSVVYVKQPDSQIDPNNPLTWPSGVTENDVKRTITRTITFQLPDGTSKQVTQTVTFTRGGSVDAVTGKITWQPWSEDGKHHFDRVNVPQFKGYNSSIDMIDGLDVTPDTKLPNGGSIMIEYAKQGNLMIDPNDPSTWPDGVTKDDLFRHLERDIIYQLPDGTRHTIHQGVDFTRSGEIDPVTGKITWHSWSHNGKYHFDNVDLPHVRGYVSNPLFIPGLDVTPDTKLSGADAEIVVSYIKQANKFLTINDPASWPRGMTADDFKKVVTRTINFHLPTGIKTQVQTVTLLRTGELDAVTGQVIWNPFDMGQFEALKVPQADGYQASLNEVPEMLVDGNSKNLVVDVDYRSVEKHDDNDSDKDKNLTSLGSIDTGKKSQGLVLGAKSASVPVNNGTVASSTSTIASVSLMGSNTNSVSNLSSKQKSDKQAALPQTGSNRDQTAILGLAGTGLLLGASGLAFKKKRE